MEPTFRASMNWLHTWASVVLGGLLIATGYLFWLDSRPKKHEQLGTARRARGGGTDHRFRGRHRDRHIELPGRELLAAARRNLARPGAGGARSVGFLCRLAGDLCPCVVATATGLFRTMRDDRRARGRGGRAQPDDHGTPFRSELRAATTAGHRRYGLGDARGWCHGGARCSWTPPPGRFGRRGEVWVKPT